jgi:proton-dependent oligopeptide transporter, POT family
MSTPSIPDSNHVLPPAHGWFSGQPRGLPMLFFVELWERFSYYGMRALLVLFMVLPAGEGGLGLGTVEAATLYGSYTMAVYMLSIPGGFIADQLIGARAAVLVGGAVIALGHYALAIPSNTTFYAGLILVALGTGLFKPNISALVGALYAPDDQRRDAGFSIFYMGVNIGAFIAPLVTGFLAQSAWFKAWLAAHNLDPMASWHWGFGAAGIGMTVALALFVVYSNQLGGIGRAPAVAPGTWIKALAVVIATGVLMALALLSDVEGWQGLRWMFVALPLAAVAAFAWRQEADARRMAAVAIFFMASMLFWAVFEQAGVSIALFADQLTRTEALGYSFPSSWFQSLNAFFVIALSPLFAWAWTSLGDRQPSTTMKFALGLVFLGLSFLLMVPAAQLTLDGKVSPLWLVGLFFLQTVGELFLSPVGLSVMTRLAPSGAVGLILGVWFLGSAFGNKLAGVLGSSFDAQDTAALPAFFLNQGLFVLAASIVLMCLVPWMKRLMAGVR